MVARIEEQPVRHPEVASVLLKYPTLEFLLGEVTPQVQTQDNRPDNIMRPVYYLTKGSGMFGLENKDDAMRWKGIFNHILGSARQVYWLAEKLSHLNPDQVKTFMDLGFDENSFKNIDPELLRNFMLVSHCGRRITDETNWHNLSSQPHGEKDSGQASFNLLKNQGADPIYLELMRVEMHADHLTQAGKSDLFPDIVDNILTYCDWTFGQKPNTLDERFDALEKSKRNSPEILSLLKKCGANFEKALIQVFGENIWQKMISAGPYDWETEIRQAYCSPSGLSLEKVFPGYLEQFSQLKK